MLNFTTASILIVTTLIISFISFYYFVKSKKFLDNPDYLSVHSKSTPTCGGLIFFLTIVFGLIFFMLFENKKFTNSLPNRFYIFFFAYMTFFLISLYDDIKNFNPIYRLIVQVSLIFFCISCIDINYFNIPLKLSFLIILYLWVYNINIINFIDGSDGFLAIYALKFFTSIIFLCIFEKYNILIFYFAILIIPLLISFLFFNKPRARLFMGDCGSIQLGFLMGFASIYITTLGHWNIALSLIAYPFLDCTLTLLNKMKSGHYPWARLFDYYFLLPIKKNANNHYFVFKINLIFNILSLLIITLQILFNLKFLFIINFILSIICLIIYKRRSLK
jgi:UDP-GlcNAc:undecaprenyl-phosphate GlcNAc-1-phosphate transferase